MLFFKYEPRKISGLRNKKPRYFNKPESKSPTKTRVIETPKYRRTRRRNPIKNPQQNKNRPLDKTPEESEGPYAKRTFHFGKKK
jgi:hypothetical protein